MLADPLACVVIQQPGDVVYADCLVYHGVILGFTPGTQDADKWGIMVGNIIVTAEDAGSSLRYASRSSIGTSKGPKVGWMRILPAFTYMSGREWRDDNFESEKKLFLQMRSENHLFKVRSCSANARYSKKRKRAEILASGRAAIKK
ncbi:hypothetical protein JG688_00015326 [Phytophthora aleatoria]|uniref:Uncharacterized protein n=1 Tax=Phytophthora aleatoria TaxID=2496075 RepID=A0A8J5LZL3_9STRA|nr:hypothetical protein JG688_00015326 [Phytophthora aleatoria]